MGSTKKPGTNAVIRKDNGSTYYVNETVDYGSGGGGGGGGSTTQAVVVLTPTGSGGPSGSGSGDGVGATGASGIKIVDTGSGGGDDSDVYAFINNANIDPNQSPTVIGSKPKTGLPYELPVIDGLDQSQATSPTLENLVDYGERARLMNEGEWGYEFQQQPKNQTSREIELETDALEPGETFTQTSEGNQSEDWVIEAKAEEKPKPLLGSNSEQALDSEFEHQPLSSATMLTGERFTVDVQDQGNNPNEASSRAARKLSPFTISLLPPNEVFAADEDQASGNANPYSWEALSKYVDEKKVNLKGSDKIPDRIARANQFDTAVSSLRMLVHNGQLQPVLTQTLNGTANFGQTALFTVANVADIYLQLLEMYRTPPLILLINPQSMSINYTKIQNFSERTRYGYIYQAWGEQLPVLNFAGRIGGYYGGESMKDKQSAYNDKHIKNQATTHVSGLQEASRKVSPAYQNLMHLLMFYKNNGYIRDTVGNSQANHLIGNVEISYDGVRYVGHFDKMEWTFEETNNLGGVNFSFDFTATRIYHTDERNSIPMKMRNPNRGHRFGEDKTGRARTFRDFRDRVDGSDGSYWQASFGFEQNLVEKNADGDYEAGASLKSWRTQTEQTVVGQIVAGIIEGGVEAYNAATDSDVEYYEEPPTEGDTSGIIRARAYNPGDLD